MLNTNKPLISVALATYNGERYLRGQIDSILEQSYPNIEIVVCDDCSSDSTDDILEEYAQKNLLRYEINETNLGFIKNFEKAISKCNGEYLALCDQDDIWLENKIEKMVENIGDNILIYSDVMKVDENLQPTGEHIIKNRYEFYKGSSPLPLLFQNFVSGNAMLFSKELVKYILPIPQKHPYHDWWIGFVAANYGNIIYINEDLVKYRRHSEQITGAKSISYSSFKDRIAVKSNGLLSIVKRDLGAIKAYLNLDIKDNITKQILLKTKEHYENYNVYINWGLFFILLKYRDLVFACIPKNKRVKNVLIRSLGLKGHQMSLFSLGVITH